MELDSVPPLVHRFKVVALTDESWSNTQREVSNTCKQCWDEFNECIIFKFKWFQIKPQKRRYLVLTVTLCSITLSSVTGFIYNLNVQYKVKGSFVDVTFTVTLIGIIPPSCSRENNITIEIKRVNVCWCLHRNRGRWARRRRRTAPQRDPQPTVSPCSPPRVCSWVKRSVSTDIRKPQGIKHERKRRLRQMIQG